MRFFELTNPVYSTDAEETRRNPVEFGGKLQLPGIMCGTCLQWASTDRLRMTDVPEPHDEFRTVRFLSPVEWKARSAEWARRFRIPPEKLMPGAELGLPLGKLLGPIFEDVVHPMPGCLWVRENVRTLLNANHFRGLRLWPVELQPADASTRLWEIEAEGRAWREGSTSESITVCDECGRLEFPNPEVLSIDLARWDQSDFMILDLNPNILVVSERVRDAMTEARISNVRFDEIRSGK